MNLLYIDASMGAAGDMLTAALLELIPDKDAFVSMLNNIGIPGIFYEAVASEKCSVKGTHINVSYNGESEDASSDHHTHENSDHHEHNNVASIKHIVEEHLNITDKVKADILNVFSSIAEAESKVHGVPVTDIHFHEVGSMDAIADVTAVCMLMDRINPDRVIVSPINVGSGTVKCAHGILSVPAPATEELLKGMPYYTGAIKSELCTPTGAALLRYFADEFSDNPIKDPECIGRGMGTKDFEAANCVTIYKGVING